MASSAGAFQLNNLSLHKNSSAPSLATGDVLRPVEPKRRASFATPSLLTSKTAEQYPSIEEVPTPIEHQGPVFLLQDLALPSQTSPSLETKDRITNDSVTEEDTHIRAAGTSPRIDEEAEPLDDEDNDDDIRQHPAGGIETRNAVQPSDVPDGRRPRPRSNSMPSADSVQLRSHRHISPHVRPSSWVNIAALQQSAVSLLNQAQRDVEANHPPPLARRNTLTALYPQRELGGCCRATLMLDHEFAIFKIAHKASHQSLPLSRKEANDLVQAIKNLQDIRERIDGDRKRQWIVPWPLYLMKSILYICKPAVRAEWKTQLEQKACVEALEVDLSNLKHRLDSRRLLYLKLGLAIDTSLPQNKKQRLTYSASLEKPIHWDEKSKQVLLTKPAGIGESPLTKIQEEWKKLMSNETLFAKDDLEILWKKYVLGTDFQEETAAFVPSHRRIVSDTPSGNQRKWERDTTIATDTLPNADQPTTKKPPPKRPISIQKHSSQVTTTNMEVHGTATEEEIWDKNASLWLKRVLGPVLTLFKPSAPSGATKLPDIFMVLGWFPGKMNEPNERCAHVADRKDFIPELRKQIRALRGWRLIFSLKAVKAFGLYKCNPTEGGHTILEPSPAEKIALSQLWVALHQPFMRSPRKWTPRDSKDWANWVHEKFNEGGKYPFCSELSLRLIIAWSKTRLIIASTIPIVASLVVGFWYMFAHDGVDADSAAWTIASYMVTAGAFIIALLAVLSSMKDG